MLGFTVKSSFRVMFSKEKVQKQCPLHFIIGIHVLLNPFRFQGIIETLDNIPSPPFE